MFDQVFEAMRKTADSTITMQQELFNKWFSLWPGVPKSAVAFEEPQKIQKKWLEAIGEVIKNRREGLEAQFGAGLRNIEEAFHLSDAKDPAELRNKTIELWQKMFETLRQTSEAQMRDFQTAVAKWAELMTKKDA